MQFVIALFAASHQPSARRALRFAEAVLAGGHQINRLFFYQDAVSIANNSQVQAQDEFDLPAAWRELGPLWDQPLAGDSSVWTKSSP